MWICSTISSLQLTVNQAKSQASLRVKTFIFLYKMFYEEPELISLPTCIYLFFSTKRSTIFQGFFKNSVSLHHVPSFVTLFSFPHSGKSVKQGRLCGSSLEGIMRNRNSWSCCFSFCSRWAPSRVPHVSQVHHFTQAHDGISPSSFWGPNWLMASQHRPLQFPTSCKMLAKCCIKLFCCHQCQTVVYLFPLILFFIFLLTLSGVNTLYLCFHVRKSQANTFCGQNREMWDFSFMFSSRWTARRKKKKCF